MIKFVKNYFLIILSFIICCNSVSVFQALPTHAAGQYKTISDMEPAEQIASYSYYLGLKECINNTQYKPTLTSASLDEIFVGSSHEVYVGYIAESVAAKQGIKVSEGDGIMWCSNVAQAAFSLWGFNNIDINSVLSEFGYSKQKTYQCIILDLTSDGTMKESPIPDLKFTIPSHVEYSHMGNGQGWDVTIDNVKDFCIAAEEEKFFDDTGSTKPAGTDHGGKYEEVLSDDQHYTTKLPTIIDAVRTNIYGLCKSGSMSCSTGNNEPQLDNGLLYLLNKYYFENENICNAKSYGLASELKQKVTTSEYTNITSGSYGPYAEVTLITNSTTGTTDLFSYVMTGEKAKNKSELPLWPVNVITTCASVKDSLSEKAKLIFDDILNNGNYAKYEKILSAAGLADNTAKSSDATLSDNGNEEATCGSTVTGIGWIVCPIITSLTALNDGAWQIVQGLLVVNPLSQTGSDNYIYQAWGIIRNIANIAFAIIFLIIVFSQTTGFGIQNYGIKKMLPKLIIGAILVNLSFIIMQISVDLANIVGKSLYSLILGSTPDTGISLGWSAVNTLITGGLAAGLGIGGIALAGGSAAAFYLLLPALAMAALALLAAVFTLMFRQAAIPILAIIAPLAFVAYLLPNTESWFKKWKKILIDALLLYPLAAIVFSGARFAAIIIIGNNSDWFRSLMGMIILALPLGSLPFLASKGGTLTNAAFKGANNLFGKLKNPINNFSKPRAELAKSRYLAGEGRTQFGRSALGGLSRRAAKRNAYRDRVIKLNTDAANKAFDSSFEGSELGRESIINSKVAENQLKATQAANTRLINEATTATSKGVGNLVASGISMANATRIAADLHNAQRAIDIETGAANAATNIYKQKLNDDIASMPKLANAFGGIDQYGAARAIASARANIEQTRTSNINSEISNLRAMEYSSDAVSILTTGILPKSGSPATMEQRIAALKLGVQSSDYKNQKAIANYIGDTHNGLSSDDRLVLQQEFFTEFMKSSKIKSISGKDKGALQTGSYSGKIEDKVIDFFTSDKVSAEMYQQLDKDELEDFVNNLMVQKSGLTTDPNKKDARKRLLDKTLAAKTNTKIWDSLSAGVQDNMNKIIKTLK